MAKVTGDDVVYVAVKKNVEQSKRTLLWALQHLQAEKICILHVHQPTNTPHSSSGLEELEAIMHEELQYHFDICQQEGLNEDEIYISCIEMDDVGEGIVELMHESNVKKLVMGAAADWRYSESLVGIRSKKAKYVIEHAPRSCDICFICNGHLIHTVVGKLDAIDEASNDKGAPEPAAAIMFRDHYANSIKDESGNDRIYRNLEQAIREVEKSKREAFEESVMRFKAEKDAIDALRRVKELETMYDEESRLRKETEEALAKQNEELEKTKKQRDEALSIALRGERFYDKELRLRMEADDALVKEKEELERIKQQRDKALSIAILGQKFYDKELTRREETEESLAKTKEELDDLRKEKDEVCLISLNFLRMYETELRRRREAEEDLAKEREEFERLKKEKEEVHSVTMDCLKLLQIYTKDQDGDRENVGESNYEALKRTSSQLYQAVSEELPRPPSYFICPISKEIMRDPHLAADGFTYEAEALREWLNSGHDTSPMTNLRLPHPNLLPNNALRSAIHEWLQNHSFFS